jgi:molybdenum cofactor guanylyltransferase
VASDGSPITSIILAGGKGARLGSNKALQLLDGRSLIQWVVDCLSPFSTEIIIATADGESIPCCSPVTTKTVADVHRGKGPLAGLHAGLTATAYSTAVVVGCDMPFLSGALLQHMLRMSVGFDAVVPATRKGIEPLCAVYSRRCLPHIESLLEHNRPSVRELFDLVRVHYVGDEEFDVLDPGRLSLFNINSPEDLAAAQGRGIAGASVHPTAPLKVGSELEPEISPQTGHSVYVA